MMYFLLIVLTGVHIAYASSVSKPDDAHHGSMRIEAKKEVGKFLHDILPHSNPRNILRLYAEDDDEQAQVYPLVPAEDSLGKGMIIRSMPSGGFAALRGTALQTWCVKDGCAVKEHELDTAPLPRFDPAPQKKDFVALPGRVIVYGESNDHGGQAYRHHLTTWHPGVAQKPITEEGSCNKTAPAMMAGENGEVGMVYPAMLCVATSVASVACPERTIPLSDGSGEWFIDATKLENGTVVGCARLGRVIVWDPKNNWKQVVAPHDTTYEALSVVAGRDSQFATYARVTVDIYDSKGNKITPVAKINTKSGIASVALRARQCWVATDECVENYCVDGKDTFHSLLRLYDVANPAEPKRTIKHNKPVAQLLPLTHGTILVGNSDNSIDLLELDAVNESLAAHEDAMAAEAVAKENAAKKEDCDK